MRRHHSWRKDAGETPYDHADHHRRAAHEPVAGAVARQAAGGRHPLRADRDIYVLEIETQGGLIGMSYLMPLRGGLHTLDACMKELIAPHVIGRDATEVEAIWQTLYKSNFWLGRMGVTVFAQSAVDMALWDIVGKRAGLPLFRLWGAARTEIPAYGSGCFRGLGRDGMIARAKEFTAQGLKAIKMQVAHIRPWREDVQNVKAMREAMGGGIEIMIDVNMGWDADTAIQAGHRIDEFDPYWLEEPVVAEDFAGYRRIAAALKTRIVGGESHFTRNDLRPFFETPHACRSCSPTRCAAASASCARSPPPPSPGASASRRISSTRRWSMCWPRSPTPATSNTWTGTTTSGSSRCCPSKDGTMTPPERPGHGLAFRPEILKDHRMGGQRITG